MLFISLVRYSCEEVKEEAETKGRVTVEEAITAAKIRKCPNPNCFQTFIKSEGCNKVRTVDAFLVTPS